MLKLFFHIACLGKNWWPIAAEIFDAFSRSGVLSVADCICVGVTGSHDDFASLNEVYGQIQNLEWHYHGDDLGKYEFPTLELLETFCANNPEAKVMYCHSKALKYILPL
jgi:hypothetical protein